MNEAKLYFNLAHKYANKKPVIIIVTGLIGTGKTTLAEAAGKGLGCEVLSSDVIRKQLANVPLTERHYDKFDGGIYSPEFTQKTYDELFSRARILLKRDSQSSWTPRSRKSGTGWLPLIWPGSAARTSWP